MILIREQRETQGVLVVKLFEFCRRVWTNTDNDGVANFLCDISKGTRLRCTSRGICFWLEVDENLAPLKRRQRNSVTILVEQLDVWCGGSFLGHEITLDRRRRSLLDVVVFERVGA